VRLGASANGVAGSTLNTYTLTNVGGTVFGQRIDTDSVAGVIGVKQGTGLKFARAAINDNVSGSFIEESAVNLADDNWHTVLIAINTSQSTNNLKLRRDTTVLATGSTATDYNTSNNAQKVMLGASTGNSSVPGARFGGALKGSFIIKGANAFSLFDNVDFRAAVDAWWAEQ
jgi:hypothetical protein